MGTKRSKIKTKPSLFSVSCSSRNLTSGERKNVDLALRQSNSFLDSVIENIPHMIFVKDAKTLRFVRFNKAGEKLLGFTKKDMIGKNDYDFFPKAEADFFTKKDREVIQRGDLYDIPEEPIHTKKKGIRVLHTKKIPLHDEKGRPLYLLGISEDITDRLRLEREIALVSDREQRRLGQDLHDGLGQHLTGLAFLAKGLAKKMAIQNLPESDDAEKLVELMNQAISMTRNLARILNPIYLESGSLGTALAELADNTSRVFKIKCQFKTDLDVQFPDSVVPRHLFRIAQEAVDNAIKHGQAKNIIIKLTKKKNDLDLSIMDNGIGLKSDWLKSRGMGLSNMKYRAKILGGLLYVEPQISGGTLVKCRFPEKLN